MKINVFSVIIIILSFNYLGISYAQEVQVPVDEDGLLEYIDSKLEKKLGLFSDYENFREARLFQVSDTTFVLEIFYRPHENVLKVRLSLSAEEAMDFRREVAKRIKSQAPHAVLNQEGRTKLLVGTLVLSLGYYGWAVPLTFDVQDPKTAAALYMLTSGAGFFIPLSLTREACVTDAAATLSLYGGTRGIAHGIFAHALFRGWDFDAQEAVGMGMLGSFTEAISFYYIADRSNMSSGTAEVIGIGGDFGLGWGLCAAHLAGFTDDNFPRLLAGSLLLGSGGGLLVGKFLADDQPYTRGDAYVLRSAGILGAYISVAAVDIVDPEEDKVYTSSLLAGSAIGLYVGHHLVRGKDFTSGQGTLISLGELAGGLVGLGVAYLVASEDDSRSLYLALSALGATGGFWALYKSFSRIAQSPGERSSWNIDVGPYGLVSSATNERWSPSVRRAAPMIRLKFTF